MYVVTRAKSTSILSHSRLKLGLYQNEPNGPSVNAFQHHLIVFSHGNSHDHATIFLAAASINFGEKKVKIHKIQQHEINSSFSIKSLYLGFEQYSNSGPCRDH